MRRTSIAYLIRSMNYMTGCSDRFVHSYNAFECLCSGSICTSTFFRCSGTGCSHAGWSLHVDNKAALYLCVDLSEWTLSGLVIMACGLDVLSA